MHQIQARPRILAIDDDPIALEVLKRNLKGMEIVAATDGEQGLRLAFDSTFDLVLLDIVMPGIDGFEVLRRLRANPRTAVTPVVLLTVLSERQHIVRGFECGADDYLIKPIEPCVLQARVGAQIDRQRMRQDLVGRQRQEVLQRIASGLSHEINNPLFVIRGFTELLGCGVNKSAKAQVDRILEATDRISAIVRALGEFTRGVSPVSDSMAATVLSGIRSTPSV